MPRGRISPHISPARCVLLHTEVLDVAGTVGAVLTGVATDRLFGGCALRVAMHSCCATGACFLALMLACLCDMPWATHVAAIASIGFFIAGPGGVLGARSGEVWGEIWGEIWGDMGRWGDRSTCLPASTAHASATATLGPGASARGLVGYAGRSDDKQLVAAVAGARERPRLGKKKADHARVSFFVGRGARQRPRFDRAGQTLPREPLQETPPRDKCVSRLRDHSTKRFQRSKEAAVGGKRGGGRRAGEVEGGVGGGGFRDTLPREALPSETSVLLARAAPPLLARCRSLACSSRRSSRRWRAGRASSAHSARRCSRRRRCCGRQWL